MAKFTKAGGALEQNVLSGNNNNNQFKLVQLQDGNNNSLATNNFQIHSKSQKPVEFKKIQNLSVKAGGQAAVTNV